MGMKPYFPPMLRRFAHVLIALVVAMATTVPLDLRAMPMPADMAGKTLHQPCQNCPQPHQTGSTNPDKMPACLALACAGAVATLPTPVLLPGRVLLSAAYLMIVPVRWTGTRPTPDPLPPRPLALV